MTVNKLNIYDAAINELITAVSDATRVRGKNKAVCLYVSSSTLFFLILHAHAYASGKKDKDHINYKFLGCDMIEDETLKDGEVLIEEVQL